MKKFFIFAAALCASATPAMANSLIDLVIPPAPPSETVLLEGVVKTPVQSVQFYIPQGNGTLIADASAPDSEGRFFLSLNNVPCGTRVHFKAIAKTEDGRKIKSSSQSVKTAACPSGSSFARYNPAGPDFGNFRPDLVD